MGCGNSNTSHKEDFFDGQKDRKPIYEENLNNFNEIKKQSESLEPSILNAKSVEEIDNIVKEEGKYIYEAELSKVQGKKAIYTLAAREFFTREIIRGINIYQSVLNEFFSSQQMEIVEEEDIKTIISGLNLSSNSNILYYHGDKFKSPFFEYVIDNLKYNKEFYLANVIFHVTKSDFQSSKRMTDLGQIIDFNIPIRNLLVIIEPINNSDYDPVKAMKQELVANCSNLTFFFEAIINSVTVVNLAFVSIQHLVMKLTFECIEYFFKTIGNPLSRIKSLVLINLDINKDKIIMFKETFQLSKLEVFVFQPPFPDDDILIQITDCLTYSKTIKLIIIFHCNQCSEAVMEICKVRLQKIPTTECVYFEEDYFFIRNLKELTFIKGDEKNKGDEDEDNFEEQIIENVKNDGQNKIEEERKDNGKENEILLKKENSNKKIKKL